MAVALSEQTFVVVDLETTGGSAVCDRIVEVAALRVRGGEVEDRFQALVDPGVPIPPFITRLTGLTSAAVSGQPPVAEVLPDLHRFVDGVPLVAHNVSFDHGFLASAFLRARLPWGPDRVCTLRLARRLLVGLPSYKLDSLCAHLGLPYVQKHRALPDAEATVLLLARLLEEAQKRDVTSLGDLLRLQQQPVTQRQHKGQVDEAQVASLPTTPGVYLLKDEVGHVLYVGKSVNVRQRVRQHLRPSGTASTAAQPRLRKRLRYVADVEAIETGSELGALFLESKLVKRYLPQGNSLLRDFRDYPFIKVDHQDAYPRLIATRERPADGATYFGPFRRAAQVNAAVELVSERLGLRQCPGTLLPGGSACALLEMRRCLGPCVGAVTQADYLIAVARSEAVLRGEDARLLEDAAAHRDALADQLRFEEAAVLRDRIRALEAVVSATQRLRTFADRNLVVITRDATPEAVHLFLIRAGRLAREVVLPRQGGLSTLRSTLREVYGETREGPVSRDEVDEMLILDAWLRQRRDVAREVAVPPDAPEMALADLEQTVATFP